MSYYNDYAEDDALKVIKIWDSIPGQLQKHEKRFHIGSLQKGARTRDFADAFFWLEESRVANTCYAATEPNIGLKLNRNDAKYKLYMADTGLLISHAFDEKSIEVANLYKKLMLDKLEINKGMLVENLVAQMIKPGHKNLYYFSKADRENADERMEIDFLVSKPSVTSRHNICPIEVKSTARYRTSSLIKFKSKYSSYLHTPYVLHSADVKVANGIVYLPLYMAPLL